MTLLIALMFTATGLTAWVIVAVHDLIERSTSRQGHPANVFRREP